MPIALLFLLHLCLTRWPMEMISESIFYHKLRSRIQNLPNYKKTNLGDNIQFIVVFQTIEIERLSNEI